MSSIYSPMASSPPASVRGNMNERQAAILTALIESGEITEEQGESFRDVHARLIEADLME